MVKNVIYTTYRGAPDGIYHDQHFVDLMHDTQIRQGIELEEAGIRWENGKWFFPDGHVCDQGVTEAWSRLKNITTT